MKLINKSKSSVLSIKLMLQDYINLELKKNLPEASVKEKSLIKELRKNMRIRRESVPGKRWKKFARKLRIYVKYFDPRNFLRWEVITSTMFLNNIQEECLHALQKSPEWDNVWQRIIQEDDFGNPTRGSLIPDTSGTRIVHAHHLLECKKHTNIDFSKIEIIVEFGGGYGSMCRLIRKLGFKGAYILYDLPEFSYLQKFYLTGVGLEVVDGDECVEMCNSNILVDKVEILKKLLDKKTIENSLFIATWSISESPVELRDRILQLVGKFNYFLFGYQPTFDDVDNMAYFNTLKTKNADVEWSEKFIEFWNGYYLFGKR